MSERAQVRGRMPSTERENSISRKRKTELSHHRDSPVMQILHLQRTIGNQAVQRMLRNHSIQAKLRIGKPNDIYEQEADRVANQVLRMPEPGYSNGNEGEKETIQARPSANQITPFIQRQVEPEEEEEEIQTKPLTPPIIPLVQRQAEGEEEEEEEPIQTKPLSRSIAPQVQRQAEEEEEKEEEEPLQTKALSGQLLPGIQRQEEEEEEIQTKSFTPLITPLVQRQVEEEEEEEPVQTKEAVSKTSGVSPSIQTSLDSMRGGGQPLSESTKEYFGPRFGQDFSQVRLHTDTEAAHTAKELNAQAFTRGQDIFFGEGRYQPETASGKHLLAHELTHVIQQRSTPARAASTPVQQVSRLRNGKGMTVQRQVGTPSATTVKPGAEAGADVAPSMMDLKGKSMFEPPDPISKWLEERRRNTGKVKVRFGKIAEGVVAVKKSGDKYTVKRQGIPLIHPHPMFSGLNKLPSELRPSLILQAQNSKLSGFIGLGASAKRGKDLAGIIRKTPDLIGLVGFEFPKFPAVTNKLDAGKLHLGLSGVPITLGGVFSGTVTFEADEERVTQFEGSANVNVKNLASVNMGLKRSEDGLISGNVVADVKLPKNFSGGVNIVWDGKAITGEGSVGYEGEKLSGKVTLRVMEESKAKQLEQTKKAPPKEGAVSPAEQKAKGKRKKENYVVFGEGDLTFSFTDWLSGSAHVIVDPHGFVTIIGKITPQKEFELFPQKDYNKKLFKVEARASYGIPVVGNIFIFANIGMDAFAKLGPAKFYKIIVQGTYSTDPKKCKDFSIQGSLNISAAAGLRLRGEAGAGLEILAHDIKAGAGINALAGIRAYAEATPIIGYREKPATEGEDKKGEFFIRGELEIAAQPFLGLSGDLFVEIDAPWWSPCPDKKWTWPLGGKEWPIGGSIGLNATVDYVFGSGQLPSIEFKPVDFSADKFLTDLYSDKSKPKSGAAGEQKGKWKEKNTKESAPPKDGKKGDAQVGKAPELAPAKAKVKPGGPKKAVKPAPSSAKTAEGKSVKELKEEAAKKGKKPDLKEPKKGTAKEEPKAKDVAKEAHDMQLKKGLAALDAVTKRYAEKGATKEEVKAGVKSVRRKFKVFKSIIVIDGKETWDYDFTASPGRKKKGPPQSKKGEIQKAKIEFGKRLFSSNELSKILNISKTTALRRIQQWSDQGILNKLASNTFDPLTLYSFDKKKAGTREVHPNNRNKYGFRNPRKDSAVGLQILSKGLRKDSPKPILEDNASYHKDKARYNSQRPGSDKRNFKYIVAILGHKEPPGASGYWNQIGHKKSKAQNLIWNRDSKNYWGPEHEEESKATGAKAERYRIPSKEIGSHKDWW